MKTIVKSIKSIAHSFLNFYIPPLWVVVGFLVALNVWQTYQIWQLIRHLHFHAELIESEPTVYTDSEIDAIMEEERRRWEERHWREQWDFDEKIRRSLERQGLIDR